MWLCMVMWNYYYVIGNMISYINIVLYVYVLYGNIKVVGNSVG